MDCRWVDRCQAYHAVERQHGVDHLSEGPDFEPRSPRIHVSVMDLPGGVVQELNGMFGPAPALRPTPDAGADCALEKPYRIND